MHLIVEYQLLFQIDTLEGEMSSSDIILVSDGEIPNPPVSTAMMAKIESLRQQTGMEIHGLLVGKKESPALSSLCNSVDDFLVDYELMNHLNLARLQSPTSTTSTALYARSLSSGPTFRRLAVSNTRRSTNQRRRNMSLYASRKREVKSNRRQRFFEDDDDWDWGSSDDETELDSDAIGSSKAVTEIKRVSESNGFVQRLEEIYAQVHKRASEDLKRWSRDELDTEIKSGSLYSKMQVLSSSIDFMESGLVERELQAILVGEYC
jgi:hypothetical protein